MLVFQMMQNVMYLCISYFSSVDEYRLRRADCALSYTTVRDMFKEMLMGIGADYRRFGVHSLRSGGATAAAAAGVEDRLLNSMGGGKWILQKMAVLKLP